MAEMTSLDMQDVMVRFVERPGPEREFVTERNERKEFSSTSSTKENH